MILEKVELSRKGGRKRKMSQEEDKQALSNKLLALTEKIEKIAVDLEAYTLFLEKYNKMLKGSG
jgi:hypothetical protein